MKHSYRPECQCERCGKERTRRASQSATDAAHDPHRRTMHHTMRRQNSQARKATRRPVPGSQEWAETRGDDLGESPDY